MSHTPILFAGPSLHGLDPSLYSKFELRPPIKRGEISIILDKEVPPGVMVIADGIFYHYPSVGHAEIRRAILGGWEVWGVSSMGAIRAAEMVDFGMHGYGSVFERFRTDADFTDDEVALHFLGEWPYIPITEPLIHIRKFLSHLRIMGSISASAEGQIINALSQDWFGNRDLIRLKRMIFDFKESNMKEVEDEIRKFDRFRVKNSDLRGLLSTMS